MCKGKVTALELGNPLWRRGWHSLIFERSAYERSCISRAQKPSKDEWCQPRLSAAWPIFVILQHLCVVALLPRQYVNDIVIVQHFCISIAVLLPTWIWEELTLLGCFVFGRLRWCSHAYLPLGYCRTVRCELAEAILKVEGRKIQMFGGATGRHRLSPMRKEPSTSSASY